MVNTTFINRSITQNFNDIRIEINESYDVTVDGLYTPAIANALIDGVDSYAYALTLSNSMDVTIKNATANGKGWGGNRQQ
ncbi:hypothetical protein CO261_000874 [Escherichia coli]|uniref:hypothetical protein n=1 Tax=Escherichia coli TaxID=562 RepID=UPI0017F98CD0|nr:hypothetical protein [Escherichia coli]EFD8821252.1 hypothetical protein [Escherichia coli]HAM4495652.1 hypothetical protein [Escherichia coli]HCW3014249.1 hypothetical protein [Escherichia coli]